MKYLRNLIIVTFVILTVVACGDDEDPDKEKPVIDISIENAFPTNCDTIYFGETFELKLLFTDNEELGSFSIDIHNNFDHHSHSTEVTECNPGANKEPINPFALIESFSIPDGLTIYETNQLITIPAGNNEGLYDEGDYHFFIRVTDKAGWSTYKGLSIKMFHKQTAQ
ncbi:DUF4625 domain-containing protein [Thermophagus sp. OGC60D27]|uniref:DUF4625 domain-containing protein n=1 Tax=Thermophagus sp. OGC60D27 TaxID=3458415 RepID=UPI0040382886